MKITLPGNVRAKKNSRRLMVIGGRNCPARPMSLPSNAYVRWAKEVREAIGREIPCATTGLVSVCAHFYVKGQAPDLSGALESVGDVLEGVVWKNDRQIVSWDGSRIFRDKANPRTEVWVEEHHG